MAHKGAYWVYHTQSMNLKKISILAASAVVLYGILFVLVTVYRAYVPQGTPAASTTAPVLVKESHDGTYTIAGHMITLKNGYAEMEAAPGSASKVITRYFGNDVAADFDLDGRQDLAFIVTQDTGGSGMFYYVVALLNKANGVVGTHAALLGDRIAPQTLELRGKNTLIANFAERKKGESFSVPPSIGRSLYLRLDPTSMVFQDVTSKQ